MNDSYEARRHIARRRTRPAPDPPGGPPQEVDAQTEFYEHHWAPLMTGNQLGHIRAPRRLGPRVGLALFGDWFGGPLRPLFGSGIRDVRIVRDGWSRWLPAGSHSRYFRNAAERDDDGTAGDVLRAALDLASTRWAQATALDPAMGDAYTDRPSPPDAQLGRDASSACVGWSCTTPGELESVGLRG